MKVYFSNKFANTSSSKQKIAFISKGSESLEYTSHTDIYIYRPNDADKPAVFFRKNDAASCSIGKQDQRNENHNEPQSQPDVTAFSFRK